MNEKSSFSGIERELAHKFREKINTAEDVNDLRNVFANTACELLNKAVGNEEITTIDIAFDPSAENYFKLSEKLQKEKKYVELWKNSDVGAIITRFADSSNHRYIHLMKHPEKTNLKIKN